MLDTEDNTKMNYLNIDPSSSPYTIGNMKHVIELKYDADRMPTDWSPSSKTIS